MKVFISYNHKQGKWVWDRLKPCLEAGGADVLIDRERFEAGKALVGQMDTVQDSASTNVLALSKDYLKSAYCTHEMDRAVARDPDFKKRVVIPVRLDDCKLPPKIAKPNPVFADLTDERDEGQWDLLMRACRADLGTVAPQWLRARDDVVRFLKRNQSVNLLVGQGTKWEGLIRHIQESWLPDLKIVDLQSPATASRRGLLGEILRAFGVKESLPDKPGDLVTFDELLKPFPRSRLTVKHFDYVAHRRGEYEIDLFVALRDLTMAKRKLVLLVQSRQPFAALLPTNHPLSHIDLKTVELRARP